jgi:hypothetical protein
MFEKRETGPAVAELKEVSLTSSNPVPAIKGPFLSSTFFSGERKLKKNFDPFHLS